MSSSVTVDAFASDPTSTDHFRDPSGLYSFELYRAVNIVSYVFAGASILLSIFIIASAYVLHRNPRTRHTVNRVSFRLMCLSMFAEIVYDVVYLGTYVGDSGSIGNVDELTTKSVRLTNPSCTALVYFLFSSMGVINWLFTAIAVNLMLIVVYNVSPKKKRLERWYIILSLILGVGVPLVPAILGHFGQDVYYRTCYFTATDPRVRRVHFLLDIYLWQGISCLIMLFCTISVLVSLFRTSRNTARALFLFNRQNTTTSAQPQTSNVVELKDRYIRTSLRISSYPIALVIINGILTAGDLFYNENGGVDDTGQAFFAALYTWFYGGRGLILALIGIFVDPCLRNGYRARRSPILAPPVLSTVALPAPPPSNASAFKPALSSRRPSEPWHRRSSEVMELSYDPPSSGSQETESYKYPAGDPEIPLRVEYPPTASVDSDEAEMLYGEVEAQL